MPKQTQIFRSVRRHLERFSFIVSLVVLCLLQACADEEDPGPMVIDPQVQDLVDLFIEEAEIRNVNIDMRGLKVKFVDEVIIDGNAFCGQALELSPNALIHMSQPCWEGFTDFQKEVLMFHELGHAILFRNHLDTEFESGAHVSLMHRDGLSEYNQWTLDRRDYYIDELFGTHDGTTPDWALLKENERIVYEDSFDSLDIWQLVKNNGETPESHITGGLDSSRFDSGPYSLAITSNDIVESDFFNYWRISLDDLDIAPDSQLELVARIRGENIDGRGIVLSIRGDQLDVSTAATFDSQTFENQGTFGFRNVKLLIDHYTPVVNRINIFFVMRSNTSGTAYLDDLKLIERF